MADELNKLAERVEALTGPDRDVDQAVAVVYRSIQLGRKVIGVANCKAYTASLDAAMSLVPEGWNWMAGQRNQGYPARAYVNNGKPHFTGLASRKNPEHIWYEVEAATPALALTAAALRAREVIAHMAGHEVKNA